MRKRWPLSFVHEHTPEAISERLSGKTNQSVVRDLIYGAIDGTVTTFSIVAGVSGAELSDKIILILGMSNVLADGFSMAAGNYLATKAELEERALMKEYELEQMKINPSGEEEEIRQIFKSKGFEGELLEKTVDKIVKNREEWLKLMLSEEYGIHLDGRSPLKAAAVTFLAFIAFGLIPMLPFAFGAENDFFLATVMTGISFCLLGTLKSFWSLERAWISSLKTFLVGSCAATLAYVVGVLLKDIG